MGSDVLADPAVTTPAAQTATTIPPSATPAVPACRRGVVPIHAACTPDPAVRPRTTPAATAMTPVCAVKTPAASSADPTPVIPPAAAIRAIPPAAAIPAIQPATRTLARLLAVTRVIHNVLTATITTPAQRIVAAAEYARTTRLTATTGTPVPPTPAAQDRAASTS